MRAGWGWVLRMQGLFLNYEKRGLALTISSKVSIESLLKSLLIQSIASANAVLSSPGVIPFATILFVNCCFRCSAGSTGSRMLTKMGRNRQLNVPWYLPPWKKTVLGWRFSTSCFLVVQNKRRSIGCIMVLFSKTFRFQFRSLCWAEFGNWKI